MFSRFGVMFFADPVAAFSNIRVALQSGGRLTFVCWQPLDRNPWMAAAITAATRYLERPEPPGPDDPGPFAFRDPDRVRQILTDAGFAGIDIAGHEVALRFEADVDGTADKLLQLGPMAQPVAQAGDDLRARIRAELAAAIEGYQTDRGVEIDSASWIASAHAP